jgi:hypothetical protein
MEGNELLVQAEQLLEENRYSEAAKLFQRAAHQQLPTSAHLMNWSVADEQARLSELRAIAGKYPCSLECHLWVINQLLRIGMGGQAAAYCTEIIDAFRDPKDELQIRLLRLRAELSGRKIGHVVEDFLRAWHAELSLTSLARVRSRLLRHIAAINDEQLLPVLEELYQNKEIEDQAGLFMTRKIEEMKLLAETTEALNNTGARHPPVRGPESPPDPRP